MWYASVVGEALGVAAGLLLCGAAVAADWPDACQQSTLSSDGPNDPSEQLILTCVPQHFNGALIIYAHGYVKPQEPLALPKELGDSDLRGIIKGLLDRGFGVATSSYHKNGYAVEQAEADLNDLVDHIKSSGLDVDAVYVTGASEGGLVAAMLVEKYPETYAGGLALCGPLAGVPYQTSYMADVRVLFDAFYPEVFQDSEGFPFDVPADAPDHWRGPDGSKAKIAAAINDDPDAIAQVFDVADVACDGHAPDKAANCTQDILAYSEFGTNDLLDTAGGWPVTNANKRYRGSEHDAALNTGVQRFDANPDASAYARRYYRPSGRLKRPLVTLHTTRDPIIPYRHELTYLKRAILRGRAGRLTVLPVDRAGHCAFTGQEVLGGLAALLLEADSDLVLSLAGPLERLRGIIDVGEGAGRIAKLVQDRARAFVNEVDDRSGLLNDAVDDASDSAEDAVEVAKAVGDDASDRVEDLF